jgi:putative NADH-flavin reductase
VDLQIAVLGATGRTGSRIVLFALEKGIYVAVLVRDPLKFYRVIGRPLTDQEANRLLVIHGDPTNSVDVERTVKEADVVYETVGKLHVGPCS